MTEFLMLPSSDRCANARCSNLMGRGPWCMVTVPALVPGPGADLPSLLISMCAPCATRLSHETISEREGS